MARESPLKQYVVHPDLVIKLHKQNTDQMTRLIAHMQGHWFLRGSYTREIVSEWLASHAFLKQSVVKW